jgi:hypothetical protein
MVQDSDKSSIAVSKPCCPVCYEFLDVLRDDTPDFHIRGRHTTFYPVNFPHFLPQNILETMVDRFRQHLRQELIVAAKLLEPRSMGTRHHRTYSEESNASDLTVSTIDTIPEPDVSGRRSEKGPEFSVKSQAVTTGDVQVV